MNSRRKMVKRLWLLCYKQKRPRLASPPPPPPPLLSFVLAAVILVVVCCLLFVVFLLLRLFYPVPIIEGGGEGATNTKKITNASTTPSQDPNSALNPCSVDVVTMLQLLHPNPYFQAKENDDDDDDHDRSHHSQCSLCVAPYFLPRHVRYDI